MVSRPEDAAAARFMDVFAGKYPPDLRDAQVVAVVLCYNEELRLPFFLKHHKYIGIDAFIFIDNLSTDCSARLLEGDNKIVYLQAPQRYNDFKSTWREVVADACLVGKWVLFIDVDELLIYPTWPRERLAEYCRRLTARGFDALHTTMVDMYPAEPLARCRYTSGASFFDVAPWFDTGNYRLIPSRRGSIAHWPTPPFRVFGGARERLFEGERTVRSPGLDRLVWSSLFPLSREPKPRLWRHLIDRAALAGVGALNGSPQLKAKMNKVPLLKWRRGSRFRGGVHAVSQRYNLAADWGALLHFKYLEDFGDKIEEAVGRGQHANGSRHYRTYQERWHSLADRSLLFEGSRRFTGIQSLLDAGLMRSRDPGAR